MSEVPQQASHTSNRPDDRRRRRKWVRHGLSNATIYSGLFLGGARLPISVLRGISLVLNGIAIILMRRTLADLHANFRAALGVSGRRAAELSRQQFFAYGRAAVDTARARSGDPRKLPVVTTLALDAEVLASARAVASFGRQGNVISASRGGGSGRGFLLVTGHVGNWELGAVTLRAHGLQPAVVGQPELDPRVHQLRLETRERLGVASIDIGGSMGTAFQVRAAVEAGQVVALLVDRTYPEDEVVVPFFGRPTKFLRTPALLARFCDCPILPGFFLRNADGTYRNVWAPLLHADRKLSPDEDARRVMTEVAAALEAVVREEPAQWFNFYRYWS